MIGLGMQELVVLFGVGILLAGAAVTVAVQVTRGGPRHRDLEAENRRRRDGADRLGRE